MLSTKQSVSRMAGGVGMSAGTGGSAAAAGGANRPFRPCDDCTCSPGLLSRQGKRASFFLKQYERARRNSRPGLSRAGSTADGVPTVQGTNESVYSCDSLCQSYKEVNTTERLLKLRKQMVKHDLCCYIVPSEDAHQSEYVSARDERRSFISGFTGSAGVACITRDLLNFNEDHPTGKSILSTDGRYFNQALQELDYNWSLLRMGEDKLSWQEWCIAEAVQMSQGLGNKTVKIGIDPKLFSYKSFLHFQELIGSHKNEVLLVPVEENLIDKIWSDFEQVPEVPSSEIYLLSKDFHGEDFAQKKNRLIESVKRQIGGTLPNINVPQKLVVVALDEIAWLLNLRGSDIKYNPVFYSFLILSEDITELYMDNAVTEDIREYLDANNVKVKPYNGFWKDISSASDECFYVVPDTSSWQLIRQVSSEKCDYKMIHSQVDVLKAVKNSIEVSNAHRAQVKDSLCIIQYFAWLEDRLINHDALIDEYHAAEKLTEIRKTQKNFKGNSFETISSTGANAAVIHYSPPKENSSMIDPTKIYLCDCGAQFLEGTTDITRTLHLTKPKDEEIRNYTLVLKGNLALERLVFPRGVNGYQIDAIARQYLWAQGLDYKHGTGHGIGSHLNVHEGPIGIGMRRGTTEFPLQPGNILSNEPGFYKDGDYGIRIENDMLVKPHKSNDKFLTFENLTLVPYCRKLIDTKLLTKEEKLQLNEYNTRIWELVVQYMQPQSIAYKWLKRETAPF